MINNVILLGKERTYAIEDIDTSFDMLAKEETETLGSIERRQRVLSKINEKTKIVKSKTGEIQKEINKLKELDLSEEYNFFIEKLSESHNKHQSYSESIEKVVEQLDKLLQWVSHYVKLNSYIENIIKNEELIDSYFETENYNKIGEILSNTKEKITLAKNELSEADKIIKFSFSTKLSTSLNWYSKYADSLTKTVKYMEDKDFIKIKNSINEALSFVLTASEATPTKNEVGEEMEKWYNEEVNELINQANTYKTEAGRAYNDAFEIYENI